MRNSDNMSSSSSFEALGEGSNRKATAGGNEEKSPISCRPANYESTSSGDVVVVEPSFDADDNDGRSPVPESGAPDASESRSAPSTNATSITHHKHRRNLSEHFYDATTLSNADANSSFGSRAQPPPTISPTGTASAATVGGGGGGGRKHRRVFSGETSNPPEAHRRINSIGNSTSIRRRSYAKQRQHQRVDSAGLDILTAAADVSREELAAAAGERGRSGRHPWEPPAHATPSSTAVPSRRSPIEMVTYDHSSGSNPPPPPRSHHRHYPPPPGSYYPPHHGYPHPSYPPPPFYSTTPNPQGYPPHPPVYPTQYAPGGPDPYLKHPAPLQQPMLERPSHEPSHRKPSAPPGVYGDEKHLRTSPVARDGNLAMTPPPPVPPSHWRGGTTRGVQTFVTTIGVGEGSRTVHSREPVEHHVAGVETRTSPSPQGHHRKTSSLSSWVPMSVLMGPPGESSEHPLKRHHRSTSSSVSFLGNLDVNLETDATFLQNLQASTGTPAHAFSSQQRATETKSSSQVPEQSNTGATGSNKLAPGGTSKRVRRKCTIEGCQNRVVQGGLCIAHGAKRKQCKHPGCTKNVKKAGLCSTHGPARKRCEAGGCSKVAVQGGRCIAHGAKKKLCSIESCTKQAILSGMCKKHHDQTRNSSSRVAPAPGGNTFCKPVETPPTKPATSSRPTKGGRKPTHTRGLSIFQEISAADVGTLLAPEAAASGENPRPAPAEPPRHRPTLSQEFASLY